MVTTEYKIVEGSIRESHTQVDGVKIIEMDVIPTESISTDLTLKMKHIKFKWNNSTGCPAFNLKALAEINATDDAEISAEELAIVTALRV